MVDKLAQSPLKPRDGVTRRFVMGAAGALGLAPILPRFIGQAKAAAGRGGERHGLSVYGDLKYGVDFAHFDYVNPDAPKGGTLSIVPSTWYFNQNPHTFNTLNTLVLKGDAPVGLHIIYDTLMTGAADEPDSVYGLVARRVRISDDGNAYTFFLRPQARFHDGSPLTADDVVFSFDIIKAKGYPDLARTLHDMKAITRDGDDAVTVHLKPGHARTLPVEIASSIPILPKAWYDTRDFTATTLERPLASGPYKVGKFKPGSFIDYERVKDYWARDLPVMRGAYNFDIYRMNFFRDSNVAFEAFKAHGYNLREEYSSKTWATGYDFPALADGRVVREKLPKTGPDGRQGWYLNTRRSKLADRRVREALIYAFDFEWTNKTLMYGSYTRTVSFFQNTDMMAEGVPDAAELTLLEPFRGQVRDEVFGEPFTPPVTDGSGHNRKNLRHARQCLEQAGWVLKDGQLRNAAGEAFTFEILETSPVWERICLPYIKQLKSLGISAKFRLVDAAQYQSRIKDFDFDAVARNWVLLPGIVDGDKLFFDSEQADQPGSVNLSGIRDPVVDSLLQTAIDAKSREKMATAGRALDRVLRSGRYFVPHWHDDYYKLAYWDVFGHPAAPPPRYSRGYGAVETWWAKPAADNGA